MREKPDDKADGIEESVPAQPTFARFPMYDHSGQPTMRQGVLQQAYEALSAIVRTLSRTDDEPTIGRLTGVK